MPQFIADLHFHSKYSRAVSQEMENARRREKYLKTTEGKRFLKMQIRDLLLEIKK